MCLFTYAVFCVGMSRRREGGGGKEEAERGNEQHVIVSITLYLEKTVGKSAFIYKSRAIYGPDPEGTGLESIDLNTTFFWLTKTFLFLFPLFLFLSAELCEHGGGRLGGDPPPAIPYPIYIFHSRSPSYAAVGRGGIYIE